MSNNETGSSKFCVRRGLMRGAGVFAVLAALAGSANAQGHMGRHFGGGPFSGAMTPAQMEERLERMLKHLYVELDATEEQKQKIAPIVKQAAREMMPMREAMMGTRKQAISLFTAERIDRAAIEALRADRLKAAETGTRRMTQALMDIAEVLTPAQRKTLGERMARRRGLWSKG